MMSSILTQRTPTRLLLPTTTDKGKSAEKLQTCAKSASGASRHWLREQPFPCSNIVVRRGPLPTSMGATAFTSSLQIG